MEREVGKRGREVEVERERWRERRRGAQTRIRVF